MNYKALSITLPILVEYYPADLTERIESIEAISLDDLDNDRDLELVTKGQGQDLILYRMN